MIAEIEKYIEIQNNIDQILKDSPFKISYIIEKTGIKKPTFFKKMKEKKIYFRRTAFYCQSNGTGL